MWCLPFLVAGHVQSTAHQQALVQQGGVTDCECCQAQLSLIQNYCDEQKKSLFDGDYELKRYACPAEEECCTGTCASLVAKAQTKCCDACTCLPECPACHAKPPPTPKPPTCEPVDPAACQALALRVKKLVLALMPTGEQSCGEPLDAPRTLPQHTSSAACRMHVPDILELACEARLPDATWTSEDGPSAASGRGAAVALERAVALAAADQARNPRMTAQQYAMLVSNASKALPMSRLTCRRLLAAWIGSCPLGSQPGCAEKPSQPPLCNTAQMIGLSEPLLSQSAHAIDCPACLPPLSPMHDPQCFLPTVELLAARAAAAA